MNATTETVPARLQVVIDSAYNTEHGRGWVPCDTSARLIKELVKRGLAEMVGSWPKLTSAGMCWRSN